ncbi:MAG: hypothetical protein ACJAT2_001104 [Bacteriovoracaceae bacterium]|jgi:hypothetical protein
MDNYDDKGSMKKVLFLLFFLASPLIACDDHPTADSKSPLWVKYLVKAASKKDHDHSHKDHKHEVSAKDKKDIPKKAK